MNDVHEVTTVAPKRTFNKKKIAQWSAVGIFAFGTLLLIDDKLKSRKAKRETPDTES